MKDKIVTIIDYVNKLLAVMLSVYFIATLIYKNQYVSISIDVLMLGIMITAIPIANIKSKKIFAFVHTARKLLLKRPFIHDPPLLKG